MPRCTLLLSWTIAGLLLTTISAAPQALILGSPEGRACYLAAKSGAQQRQGIAACDAALKDETLSLNDRASTLVNRGVLYDRLGQNSDGLKDFNASIAASPQLGDAYLNRGAALIRLQRFDEALADVQKAMELGVPSPAIGYYDLAVSEEGLGLSAEAYHDYQLALAADPTYTLASEALKRFTQVQKSGLG